MTNIITKLFGAVALVNVNIFPVFVTRVAIIVLFCITALSYNAFDSQAIGFNTKICFRLDGTICAFSSAAFIPYSPTLSLLKGIKALNRMYISLDNDDPLKSFLDTHCKHLLKPLLGQTTIPIEFADPQILLGQSGTVKLATSYASSQFSQLPGIVCIYAFYLEQEKNVTQCGSTVSLLNRMNNHYRDAAKKTFIFANKSIDEYFWTPILFSENFVSLFQLDNPMTPEQECILIAFTEQSVRSLEQAYTTYARPSNYKGIAISTSHNNWKVGDKHRQTDAKRITWATEQGKEYSRQSMSASQFELGYSLNYIKKVVQSDKPYLHTKKYGLVKLRVNNINELKQDIRYGTRLNMLIDKTNLRENHYYLYSKDMVLLPYGPFANVADANLAIGLAPNYSGTYLWGNYMHTVKAIGLGMEVYIVKGISTTKIPIIVTSSDTGLSLEYNSISSALKVIWPNNRGGYSILKAMVKGKPLTTPKNGTYLLTFKYSEHLALSIKLYNSHKMTHPKNIFNPHL